MTPPPNDPTDRILAELQDLRRRHEALHDVLHQALLNHARMEETIRVLQAHDQRLQELCATFGGRIYDLEQRHATHLVENHGDELRRISNLEQTANMGTWIAASLFVLCLTAIINTLFGGSVS